MRAAGRISCALLLFSLTLSGLWTSDAQEAAPGVPPTEGRTPVLKKASPPISGEGTAATIVDARYLESVLGRDVLSPSGENLGRIVDVLADRSGRVRAAVIDFGGFLGVGIRKIAVDWRALHFELKGKSSLIRFELTREQLRVAPEVKPGEPVAIIGVEPPLKAQRQGARRN
jgi:hypothetical protein